MKRSALGAILALVLAVTILLTALLAGRGQGAGDEAPAGPAGRASRPPVVVVIFDEFPTDDLVAPDGRIDRLRFPNFARLARISDWFPNGHTVFDSSFQAVPAILDARMPGPRKAPDVRSHQPSIYHLMDRLGYEIHRVESASALCPPRICPDGRTRRPGVLDRLKGGGRPARLNAWMAQIRRRERPALYLQHTLLPHEPWIYLPSGRQNRPSGEDPIRGINRRRSFDDVRLSQHNHMRHLLQVGYVDHQLGRLLDRLRDQGMLRRTLIAVVADHGYSYDIGARSRRLVTETNIDEIAPVPFFVKAPGQMRGRVNRSFVRNIDLVPTIAEMLGTKIWWPHDGRSAYSAASRERNEMVLEKRDFSGLVSIGRQELAERRAANRERWARLFGTGVQSRLVFGDPWASVYRIGPNAELLDRLVTGLPERRPVSDALLASAGKRPGARTGQVRAAVANAELLRDVGPEDPIEPTRITGTLEGSAAEGRRDLAVAVNGRVRAVGRSFRFRPGGRELFSFVVPETALRRGDNRVEVFEVVDGGRALIPLPSADFADGIAPVRAEPGPSRTTEAPERPSWARRSRHG